MADSITKRMIRAYVERAPAPMFLSGFFQSPPENFHNQEEVEVDIERETDDVAIVIKDLRTGARSNSADTYEALKFKPPVYDEEGHIIAYDVLGRQPGSDPYADVDFQANASRKALSLFRKIANKINRSVELQCAQVLANGQLDLKDENGTTLFSIDYGPKASHFTTAGVDWGTGTEDKLAQIEGLADTILTDGRVEPTRLVFGRTALLDFLNDDKVQGLLDNRRMNLGSVQTPQVRGAGGRFHGTISVGQFTFEIWSYGGSYRDPQTGNNTKFVTDDHVLMLGDGRLDLTFGAIPQIVESQRRALPFLPSRISDGEAGVDLTTNAYFSPDGRSLTVQAGTRPLAIPTAIDTIGRLDTVA